MIIHGKVKRTEDKAAVVYFKVQFSHYLIRSEESHEIPVRRSITMTVITWLMCVTI